MDVRGEMMAEIQRGLESLPAADLVVFRNGLRNHQLLIEAPVTCCLAAVNLLRSQVVRVQAEMRNVGPDVFAKAMAEMQAKLACQSDDPAIAEALDTFRLAWVVGIWRHASIEQKTAAVGVMSRKAGG